MTDKNKDTTAVQHDRYDAETVLTNILRHLRKGARDLAYTAPEMWMERTSRIMQDVHSEAEAWNGAGDVD